MRRWLISTIACGIGFSAAMLGLVFASDVFALYGTRAVPRNIIPPNLRLSTGGDRTIKAFEIARIKEPLDLVFIGSSRVVFAFDPTSPALSGLTAYNAGLNGSHSNEAAAVLRYVVDRGPPVKRIVWNIDFEEFFRESEGSADFEDSGFAGKSALHALARHALSYEALRKTVGALLGGQALYIDVNGFYHYERQDRASLASGRDSVALPSIREWFPGYAFMAGERFEKRLEDRLATIADALRHARAHGIAVDVISMPVHVSRRALFDIGDLQPEYELWKKRLAETVASVAAGQGAPVRAYDFSEMGEVAFERFMPGDPLQRSRLFYEILHPKPVVGDMIVARLLSPSAAPGQTVFGEALAETARPERLAADRASLRNWEAQNPGLVEEIASALRANDRRPVRSAEKNNEKVSGDRVAIKNR